ISGAEANLEVAKAWMKLTELKDGNTPLNAGNLQFRGGASPISGIANRAGGKAADMDGTGRIHAGPIGGTLATQSFLNATAAGDGGRGFHGDPLNEVNNIPRGSLAAYSPANGDDKLCGNVITGPEDIDTSGKATDALTYKPDKERPEEKSPSGSGIDHGKTAEENKIKRDKEDAKKELDSIRESIKISECDTVAKVDDALKKLNDFEKSGKYNGQAEIVFKEDKATQDLIKELETKKTELSGGKETGGKETGGKETGGKETGGKETGENVDTVRKKIHDELAAHNLNDKQTKKILQDLEKDYPEIKGQTTLQAALEKLTTQDKLNSFKSAMINKIESVSQQVVHYQEYIRGEKNIGSDRQKIEEGAQTLKEIDDIEQAILTEVKVELQKKGKNLQKDQELEKAKEKLDEAQKKHEEKRKIREKAEEEYKKLPVKSTDLFSPEESKINDDYGSARAYEDKADEYRQEELKKVREKVIDNIQNELKRAKLAITDLNIEFTDNKT
ncbi:3951_t:CDS:2, partial [Entrophospora sp. SA101]